MRQRTLAIAVFTILTIISSSAFAQSPQITSGLTWLYSAQTPTGNWPEVVTTDYYSTAAALDAVSALDPSNPAYSTGFQWLSTQVVSPADYLSRQIIALKQAGQDTSGDVATLLLYRNADGGWGGDSDYLDDVIDTALALQALHAVNYPDLSVDNTALAYLTNTQNSDGGWGFSNGDASNICHGSFPAPGTMRPRSEKNGLCSVYLNMAGRRLFVKSAVPSIRINN